MAINDIKLLVDGKKHQFVGASGMSNDDSKISLPNNIIKAFENLPNAKDVYLKWSYEMSYNPSIELVPDSDYGPDAIFSFISEDDLENIRYAGLVTRDYDWNTHLYVCDRQNGTNVFGHQRLIDDYSKVDDLHTWTTYNTAVQIELSDGKGYELIEPICRQMSERLSSLDEIIVDGNDFYFALNNANINSDKDMDFYIDSIKKLYELTNGNIYTEPHFYHASDKAFAVMKVFFNESDELQIKTTRA